MFVHVCDSACLMENYHARERFISGRYGMPAAEVIGEPYTTFASSQVAYVHTHWRHGAVRGLVLEI